MLALRVWEHRRTVEPVPGGCRVTDALAFRTRRGAPGPVAAYVVGVLFRHRHRRLVARYGALPR